MRHGAGPARHELPAIDGLALEAGREAHRLLAMARARGLERWLAYFDGIPDLLLDGSLADIRRAARRVRSAYGASDSVRDALPADVTEPLLAATDRLIVALNRLDHQGANA